MRAGTHFRADDGLDARGLSRLRKFHGPVQVARVRQGDCGQALLLRQLHDGGRRKR